MTTEVQEAALLLEDILLLLPPSQLHSPERLRRQGPPHKRYYVTPPSMAQDLHDLIDMNGVQVRPHPPRAPRPAPLRDAVAARWLVAECVWMEPFRQMGIHLLLIIPKIIPTFSAFCV